MITSFESLSPSDTLSAAENSLLRTTQTEFPVVAEGGALVGFLTRAQIVKAKDDHYPGWTVSASMTADIPTVLLTTSLETVLQKLREPEIPAVAVYDQNGNFLGYITRENFGEWLLLNR